MYCKTVEEVMAKYPALYERCYISCGDGWAKLLDVLSEGVSRLGEGMAPVQVKEKFGGLRYYMGETSDAIEMLIAGAEQEAWHTCEACGSRHDVETRGPGWFRTQCKPCYEKRMK